MRSSRLLVRLDARIHERQVPRVGCDRQGHRRDHFGLLAGGLPDPDRGPQPGRGDLPHPFEEPVRPQADLAQIIEKLEEKCRTMNVHLEFFEPPAVSVFVAAGGFSVRVLDKTNSINDERPGRAPETFMDDLLNRKNLAGLFTFLAATTRSMSWSSTTTSPCRKGCRSRMRWRTYPSS